MPLRDIGEYFAWIERESPSVDAQQVTRAFLLELDEHPWAAPSVPVSEVSNQPEYEFGFTYAPGLRPTTTSWPPT